MASHTGITTWSLAGSDHVISPAGSSAPSIVSVDSILSDTHKKSHGTLQTAESPIRSQAIESLGNSGKYPGVDDSFVRHPKYFFADGNITFLVEGTLYCIHRYFFSRDSTYFATRFAQLDIRDHEALPTIISLTEVERKDFDALLSILYPENFEENGLSYEQWKSVLHLSTRWGFASVRKLALSSIEPPTPHDRLLLARKYSVDHWVVPALSALCERMAPLTLSEARGMDIEDVILVSTVREDIRNRTLQVDPAEVPRRVEAEQAWARTGGGPRPFRVPPIFPTSEPSSPLDRKEPKKEDGSHESDGEHSVRSQTGEETPGNIGVREGESVQPFEGSRGEGAATRAVGTGASTWFSRAIMNMEIRPGEEATRRAEEEARRHAKKEAKRKAVAKAKEKAAQFRAAEAA